MDLMAIVTALCICLSILLTTPSAAMEIHEKQSSHQHAAADDRVKFSVPTLPRKLRVLLDQEVAVKSYAARSSTSLNKQKGDNAPVRRFASLPTSKLTPYDHFFQIAKHTIRNKMGCLGADQPGHGVNGSRGPTRPIFLRWIIRKLEEDARYITNPCRLVHKTWSGGPAASMKLLV
ncbi:hypothetical protein POTOM_038178 [Populus tomentosa]|uniref:Uncharacterized protein n=1 Tax=Populus tomentosa TaxID=118781 RepID=A0A8X8CL42_POPTO|nr:hypothetical protein POTOM_038178 [Populus tomentosa]